MKLITWKDEYKLGIVDIDTQHQKMFQIINNLFARMTQSEAQNEIPAILKELTDYAEYHFATEEKYFTKFQYPAKDEHMLMHTAYKNEVAKFISKQVGNIYTLPYEIIDFLENWWINHIQNADKKYVSWFHEHGLK